MYPRLRPILPSVFTRREAFHPGGDGSIDEVLLRLLIGIRENLDEGQEGVSSSKSFDQALLVIIVHGLPVYLGSNRGRRGFLNKVLSLKLKDERKYSVGESYLSA